MTAFTIARTPRSELSTDLPVTILISLRFIVTNTLELVWPTEAGTMLFAKLGYPFSTFTSAFTLAFTGNDRWLTARRKLHVLIIPIMMSLLAFTEPLHGLIWKSFSFTPVNGMLAMSGTYGSCYWIGFFYMLALCALCLILLLRESIHTQTVYRDQSILALAGIGIPLALFVVYSLKLIPGVTKNFSPIAYAAAGLCFCLSIRQHRFLDLIPIARSILLRDVTDTHLYREEKNRLIDKLTKAAKEIKTLEGIIPICMYCKNIRDDEGYGHQVEQFVGEHSNAQFSHGLCPECQKKLEENGCRMKS